MDVDYISKIWPVRTTRLACSTRNYQGFKKKGKKINKLFIRHNM